MKHPITPPIEMVYQWSDMTASHSDEVIFTLVAQWGADQELNACCEWLTTNYNYSQVNNSLRIARRPKPLKPLSLKEQVWTHITDETPATQFQAELAVEAVEMWLREQGHKDAANSIAKNRVTQTK